MIRNRAPVLVKPPVGARNKRKYGKKNSLCGKIDRVPKFVRKAGYIIYIWKEQIVKYDINLLTIDM